MKLFTKISLISAAIALGMGILGVTIGMAMGADVKDLESMGIHVTPGRSVYINGVLVEDLDDKFEFDERYDMDGDWERFEESWDEMEEKWDDFEDWQEREHRRHGKDL